MLLLVALFVAGTVLHAPGEPRGANAVVALATTLLGFGALALAGVPGRPWRPLRLTLGFGALVAGYLLSNLPWPPRGPEVGAALTLGAGVLASAVAIAAAPRAPRLTLGLVSALAALGAFVSANLMRHLAAAYAQDWRAPVVLSYLMAMSVGMAWAAALGHLLRARRCGEAEVQTHAT